MIPLTVVILTKDEELNLPGCLDSLLDVTNDIQVLDSGSTDDTVKLAQARDVEVFHHAFTGFGDQRTWAIDNLPRKHDWVFHLDADERFTPELTHEIARVLQGAPSEAGYFVASKMILGKKWLRYSADYPVYQVRLFHRDRLRYTNDGHGQRESTVGQIGYLREPYLHFAISKGIEHWLEKHVRYAALEAANIEGSTKTLYQDLYGLCDPSHMTRRRAMKSLVSRAPGRSLLRYFYLLVVKRGLLDGRAGLKFAQMMSTYEAMITTCRRADAVDIRPIRPCSKPAGNESSFAETASST